MGTRNTAYTIETRFIRRATNSSLMDAISNIQHHWRKTLKEWGILVTVWDPEDAPAANALNLPVGELLINITFSSQERCKEWRNLSCGWVTTPVPWNAIKVVECMPGILTLVVYHRRTLTCSLRSAVAENDKFCNRNYSGQCRIWANRDC